MMRGGGADGDGSSEEEKRKAKKKKEMYSWADQRVDDRDDRR